MIKYHLNCKCGETFESWFSTSNEYESLKSKKLINCIYCGSISVKKAVMAPNLFKKSNTISKKTNKEKNITENLLSLKKYIEQNCKDVGKNFPQEARNIHYDKKTSKGIYGKATPQETAELLDEGIEVATIPWIKKTEN
jgi:hypothetical protein